MPNISINDIDTKIITYYLPQFHRIPENDEWWGEGFTEWTNVKKAKPLFEGHYQPHEPHDDIGYYDLTDPKIPQLQADIASKYGIYGFCYYYYWFNGKQLLEKPIYNMLNSSKPDFPFCIMWANHDWTKGWYNGDYSTILKKQTYSYLDSLFFIETLIPFFKDKRYICIENKPLLLIYWPLQISEIQNTILLWTNFCIQNNFDGLYLIGINRLGQSQNIIDIGYQAATEFCPISFIKNNWHIKNGPQLYDYSQIINFYLQCIQRNTDGYGNKTNYPFFRSVSCGWDATARHTKNSFIFTKRTPENFYKWLNNTIIYSKKYSKVLHFPHIIFINAWNEWAEGCHLEPDKKYGYQFLEAMQNVIKNT